MGSFVDVSGRVVLSLAGAEGLDLLQRISTNDLALLKPGQNGQTILTNEKGRIIDIVGVVCLAEGRFLLAGHSRVPGLLLSWIKKFIIMEDIKVSDVTSQFSEFLVFGTTVSPQEDFAQKLNSESTTFEETWGPSKLCRVLTSQETAQEVRQRLSECGFLPVTTEVFEEYRILRGIPIMPNELSVQFNPLEANLSSLISWTKGCYIGQEVIARLDTYKKVQRSLVRMEIGEMPANLPTPFFGNEGEAGTLTSAVIMESTGACRGLGYLKTSLDFSKREFFFLRNQDKVTLRILEEPM